MGKLADLHPPIPSDGVRQAVDPPRSPVTSDRHAQVSLPRPRIRETKTWRLAQRQAGKAATLGYAISRAP